MPLLTWPESHGMFTHFPVGLLIASLLFEIGAMLFHKSEWHVVSFWLVLAGALFTIPSAITGLVTANQVFHGLQHLPAITRNHIAGAVTTLVASWITVALRAKNGDRLSNGARTGGIVLLVVTTIAVSVTGYLGGRMVFGGADGVAEEAQAGPAGPGLSTTTGAETPNMDSATVSAGEKLFRSSATGCVNCHRINGHGGSVGPDLTHEARRHAEVAWQVEHLKAPDKVHPGSAMPPFANLKQEELDALAAYLVSRK